MTSDQETKLLEDVGRIRRAVLGEEQLEQHGLVHRVGDLERWRDKVMVKVAFASGMVFVVSVAIKFLISGKF
jgi:hypothetical protein